LSTFNIIVIACSWSIQIKLDLNRPQTNNHNNKLKRVKTPTVNTNNNQRLKPEKTTPLFSDQPFGEAKTTGTPTTKANDTIIKANKTS
jgi:hypothetical protein